MSKKSRKVKRKKQPTQTAKTTRKPSRLGRRTFIGLGLAGVLAIPAYFGVAAYIDNHNNLHDLSAIGNGRPVLVQIHDPQCPLCRNLLSSVESVLNDFPDVDFRIANIKTGSGSVFANRHGVSNVTLLMFNARGEKIDTGVGFQTDEEVRTFLERNVKS